IPAGVPFCVRPIMAADPLILARELLAKLATTPAAARWHLPFPMGVFGTLRAGFRNHHLMQLGDITERRPAFLPHFKARQIDLIFHPGASAPFEIFGYAPDQWPLMIDAVDRLEGFAPAGPSTGSYQRTLAWLTLLPPDFAHPAYAAELLDAERDLGLNL